MANLSSIVTPTNILTSSSPTIASGNLNFSSTAQRITGDFSNATAANRVLFQTSTANNNTTLGLITNGTGTVTSFSMQSSSDPANASRFRLYVQNGSDASLVSDLVGTGTYLPMTFYTGGSERVRIDTTGRVGIGATPSVAGVQLTVLGGGTQLSPGTTAQEGVRIQRATGYATLSGINNDNNAYNGLQFFTGASAAVTIDTTGNVGIGTASPSSYGRLGVMTPTANYGFFGIANSAGGAGGVQMAQYYGTTKISYIDTTLTNGTPGSETAYLAFATANSGTLAERMRIDSSGNVGLGASGSAATKFYIGGTLPSSGTVSYTTLASVTIPSTSTGAFYGFYSYPATQAATFTCSGVTHFIAGWQLTGANSSITNQYGFLADSTLTSATNNFGFYGNIAAAANRWNFYAGGTANNFFAGNVGIGIATPSANLDITGSQASNIVTVAALDIDCTQGNYFIKTINGASTFTFSNPPATRAYGFTLELTHTSGTVTWPLTVRWPGNTAPTLSTANTHLFTFITDDGGSRWRGSSLVNYYQ